MKAIRVRRDGSVTLPKELRRGLPAASTLGVWGEGDTIILKRLSPVRASEIAERRSGREMPLKAIAAEVHRMRREKRGRRG